MKTEKQKYNEDLKQKLSVRYESQGVNFVKSTASLVSLAFHKSKIDNDNEIHTYDYSVKKASHYKEKYNIDILPYNYHSQETRNIIKTLLDNPETEKSTGFYAYDAHKIHIDAFIVHKGKIFVFRTFNNTLNIIHNLELYFDQNKIYVQNIQNNHDLNNYINFFPQSDYISCPVFALKYLKEALKDNAQILDMVHLIPSDDLSEDYNKFVIHPFVERYSQSDKHFKKVVENWNMTHQSKKSNRLLSKANQWRKTHDKTRMIYYLLKDLDYDSLKTLKQNIIKNNPFPPI